MMNEDHAHMFLLDGGARASLAFCKADEFTREQAEEQVQSVLTQQKGLNDPSLSYLGLVNHHISEPGVREKFKYFERHDPVWLFGVQ